MCSQRCGIGQLGPLFWAPMASVEAWPVRTRLALVFSIVCALAGDCAAILEASAGVIVFCALWACQTSGGAGPGSGSGRKVRASSAVQVCCQAPASVLHLLLTALACVPLARSRIVQGRSTSREECMYAIVWAVHHILGSIIL